MKRKLKAFTLMEVLVGMAIMGIICVSGFYAFELVQKQHALYQRSNDSLYEYQHVLQLIGHDVERAEHINRSLEGWICSGERLEVHYLIQENSILRFCNLTPDLVDTFAIQVSNLSATFKQEEKDLGIVDQLQFESSYNDLQQQNTFTKVYSAFDLMKFNK